MKVFLFLILLLCAELLLIGEVMERLGVLLTLLILLLTATLGSQLVKREGIAAIHTLIGKMRERSPIGMNLAEGGVLLLAGFLFVFPGFISDCVAVLFLVPPLRHQVALFLVAFLRRGRSPAHEARDTIIEGKAIQETDSPASPARALPLPADAGRMGRDSGGVGGDSTPPSRR